MWFFRPCAPPWGVLPPRGSLFYFFSTIVSHTMATVTHALHPWTGHTIDGCMTCTFQRGTGPPNQRGGDDGMSPGTRDTIPVPTTPRVSGSDNQARLYILSVLKRFSDLSTNDVKMNKYRKDATRITLNCVIVVSECVQSKQVGQLLRRLAHPSHGDEV